MSILKRLAPLALLFVSSAAFAAGDEPPTPWSFGVILSITALTIGGSPPCWASGLAATRAGRSPSPSR